MSLILGVVTVLNVTQENFAAGQAAENGVLTWVTTNNVGLAEETISATLQSDGYDTPGVTWQFVRQGNLSTVTVSLPVYLLDVQEVGRVSVGRSDLAIAPTSSSTGHGPIPGSVRP